MLFIDALFIPFVALTWLAYLLVPGAARIWVILASSVVFHACNGPRNLAIFAAVVAVNLLLARFAVVPRRKGGLAIAVTFNLLVLGYFKYIGFLTGGRIATPVLPIGVSFYVFQYIAFQVDLAAGRATLPPATYGAGFVAFFPHLVAGPIVRAKELVPQLLRAPRPSATDLQLGALRFCWGMAKKRIVADNLATTVQLVFDHKFGAVDPLAAWAALLGYTLQIYFDFSGYADMAIGLARCFGLTFPENFDQPYLSGSITEFWRRWHITLGAWLRDYLYIPLGGNRVAEPRASFNLFLTFLLGGLWHGASWTFVFWGAWHGVLLALERRFGKREGHGPLRVALTFALVVIGWNFFRAPTFAIGRALLESLVGLHADVHVVANFQGTDLAMSKYAIAVFAICALTFATRPILRKLSQYAKAAWIRGAVAGVLVYASYLLGPQQADFLYWQF